jgi:hypothetical protein
MRKVCYSLNNNVNKFGILSFLVREGPGPAGSEINVDHSCIEVSHFISISIFIPSA